MAADRGFGRLAEAAPALTGLYTRREIQEFRVETQQANVTANEVTINGEERDHA